MFMMYALSRSDLMYTKCVQNVCMQNVSHLLQNVVYKMNTKCIYTKFISHYDKLLYTLCIQNLAGVVLLVLYTKCIQRFVEIWYTFCRHLVDISCIHFVQFLCI